MAGFCGTPCTTPARRDWRCAAQRRPNVAISQRRPGAVVWPLQTGNVVPKHVRKNPDAQQPLASGVARVREIVYLLGVPFAEGSKLFAEQWVNFRTVSIMSMGGGV